MANSPQKLEKSSRSNGTQTETPICLENHCQVPTKESIQVQTDVNENQGVLFAEFDPVTISEFLKKVTPGVCSILQKNIASKAFDRYKSVSDVDVTSISLLHVLERPLDSEFCCTSLSWNSVGTAIATAFSCITHNNWCEHNSSVDIWSLSRKDFDPKKPNITLETDCCISHVSFHPDIPAVVAAGKLNGEILLWDVSKEDDQLLGSTETSLCNHREPITGLYWLTQFEKSNKIELATCSLDGKILLWRYENGSIKPFDGFIILAKHLPRTFPIKTRKENAEVGITSMSVNTKDRSIFLIGIEGGGIFQCSFESSETALYSSYSAISLKNPINMGFERHKGQVTTVQFSSFSRNIFLSTGSDGELRIYTLLQPKPLVVLQLPLGGINTAQWSPVRPFVFSCVSNRGQLHVWDLLVNEKSPVESCPLSVGKDSGISLEFNKENPSLLVTSSADGSIQVWELQGAIMVSDSAEELKLQAFSQSLE